MACMEGNKEIQSQKYTQSVYLQTQYAADIVHTHTALTAFASVFSDTSVCSAADRQAPSDTNHQTEEVFISQSFIQSLILPPVCHLEGC